MQRKNLIFIICIILIAVDIAISILPDIHRIKITPPNTSFPIIHNNLPDYYYYLSLMRQGYDGHWLLTTRMTPENFHPVFAQTFFAALGHFSRISKIPLPWTYFLSRIFFGASLLLVSLFLIKRIFRKNQDILIASVFVFFGTGFWTFAQNEGKIIVNQFLSFWTRFNPILRTTYLPHHLASTAIAILSLVFLALAMKKKSVKYLISASLFGAISGFIYFATMINVLGGVVIMLIIKLAINTMKSITISKSIKMIIYVSFYIVVSCIPLFYFFYLSKTTFPWSSYENVSNKFTFYITFWQYIASLGPLFILTLIGLPSIVSSSSWLSLLLLGWTFFPFVGIFGLIHIIPGIGNAYYLEATSYIPLGILAVFGIKKIQFWFNKKISLLIAFILVLFFSIPILYSVQFELSAFPADKYNIYIPNSVLAGIKWLEGNTPKESIVFAGGYLGNIIPAYSHNRVVFGHPANTYNFSQKSQDLTTFFSKKDIVLSRAILQKYKVSYIFYSLDTGLPPLDFTNRLGLNKVYENPMVKIYKTY